MKRMHAIGTALVILVPFAAAAYSDVPPGSWYARAVQRFDDAGYLGAGDQLKPAEFVPRVELVSVLVRLRRETGEGDGEVQLFDDVPGTSPHFAMVQDAAAAGWLLGDGDCLDNDICNASPMRTINRAEAAAMIERAFGLAALPHAPEFHDAPPGNWYSEPLRVAGSHCLLRGDDGKGTVRPEAALNRAEMLTILLRVYARLSYPDCREDALNDTLLPVFSARAASSARASSSASPTVTSASSAGSAMSAPVQSGASSAAPAAGAQSSAFARSSLPPGADPSAGTMQQEYYDYLTQLAYLILQAKNYTAETSPNMFRLLNQRVLLIEQYNAILLNAQARPLTATEKQSLTQVKNALQKNQAELSATQGM